MGGLFKLVALSVPVAALIFFYVTKQQATHNEEVRQDQAEVRQMYNEQMADFEKDAAKKKTYEQRAAKAAKDIDDIEEGLKVRRADHKVDEKALDAVAKDFDKQFGGKQ